MPDQVLRSLHLEVPEQRQKYVPAVVKAVLCILILILSAVSADSLTELHPLLNLG